MHSVLGTENRKWWGHVSFPLVGTSAEETHLEVGLGSPNLINKGKTQSCSQRRVLWQSLEPYSFSLPSSTLPHSVPSSRPGI